MTNVRIVCWSISIIVLFLHNVFCQSTITDDAARKCPPDSIFVRGHCECSPGSCPSGPTSCENGLVRTLIHNGTNKPGDCCDLYQCLDSSKNCSTVQCPVIPPCPADSYRLPALKSPDECCAIDQGCQCYPTCASVTCKPDEIPVLQQEATGEPSQCCSLFVCSPASNSKNHDDGTDDVHGCLTADNEYKKNGTNWTTADFCTTCTCVNGKATCHSLACAPCSRPIKVPGQCCPRCDVDCPPECRYADDENGFKICKCEPENANCDSLVDCAKNCTFGYRKNKNDCDVCECEQCSKQCSNGYLTDKKGISRCKCKPWDTRLEEDRTSLSCETDNNIVRDDGETWFDGCRQCSCISGKEMCSLIHCSPFSCSNPIINATSNCCPFCPDDPVTNNELNHMVCTGPNGAIMLEGETLMLDGCNQCICHKGMALCRGNDCPPIPCSNPLPPGEGECCASCPTPQDTETNFPISYNANEIECTPSQRNETTWREGSCVSCRCVDNRKRCYTELCDTSYKCKRLLTIKGKCCPICIDEAERYKLDVTCVYENVTYGNGHEWPIDACTRCKCISGHLECTQKMCPQSCENAVRKPGQCCPSCSGDNGTDFKNVQEIYYVVVLLAVVCVSIVLGICITRHWRYKKQQIHLRDLGCLPPQYQYKYIPNCPYDNKDVQKIASSEKASLAPV